MTTGRTETMDGKLAPGAGCLGILLILAGIGLAALIGAAISLGLWLLELLSWQ